MSHHHDSLRVAIAGLIIGVLASLLTLAGNPGNMGLCIACFVRDSVGALGLHRAAAVQYLRPEIAGIVLGALAAALAGREFRSRGGSAPMTRFVLGFCVMIGCLMFLGCPLRMLLRLAGGDLGALAGLGGFALGIGVGLLFLNRGYSLGRSRPQPLGEGLVLPGIQIALLVLLVAAPALLFFTEEGAGPGGKHAAILVSLGAGLVVGVLAQRTRLCLMGGFRDLFLFRDTRLLGGFGGLLVGCLGCNLLLTAVTDGTYFHLSLADQPVAHTNLLWNALGMLTAGLGSVLLGGCPLRQLVLAGEGSSDSAAAVLGLAAGAAFAHNLGLVSSADGPTAAGRIAVGAALAVLLVIACLNTFRKAE